MSELPKGWTKTTVGELADSIQYGHTASSTSEQVGPRFLRITDIQENRVDWETVPFCEIPESQIPKYRLAKGDLVFARTGATVGKSFLIQIEIPESIFASYLIRVRVTKAIEARYLYYFFQSSDYWHQISDSSSGIGQPNVNGKKLAAITLPIAPLPEQRRIVARIEELFSRLDAGVAALRHAKAQLQRYRQSVLAAAITGQLTQNWREQHADIEPAQELLERILKERREKWSGRGKYNGPDPLEETPPESIPESWAWASIAQIGFVQLGRQRSPKNQSKDYPTKYIRAANITEDGLDLTDLLDMEFTPDEQDRFRLSPGDLVLSEASGSPEHVGKPAIWNGEIVNCCFQNTVIRLRAEGFDKEFLLILLKHFHRNRVFAKIAGGVGINHLSAAKFSKMSAAVPPLCEQHQIVAEVEARTTAIDHLEAELDRQITRSDRLHQSILASAFSGTLNHTSNSDVL